MNESQQTNSKPMFKVLRLFIFIHLFTSIYLPTAVSGQHENVSSSGIDSVDGLPIYSIVDKMPEYAGGDQERIKFISNNIKYPVLDSNDVLQFTIYGSFVIDTSGNVTNVWIEKPYKANTLTKMEMEYLRVLRSMPPWIPGELDHKKVPVRYICPLKVDYNK
jgi:hypothetical protein